MLLPTIKAHYPPFNELSVWIQAPNPAVITKAVELLAGLRAKEVVTEYQLARGLQRAHAALPDSLIDNPQVREGEKRIGRGERREACGKVQLR